MLRSREIRASEQVTPGTDESVRLGDIVLRNRLVTSS
ncbi:MAG: hypothetical protein JWR81_3135, partial [Pseudonocardia sp.]|nr:hypothetical protein [Pseudonocardia sp.]